MGSTSESAEAMLVQLTDDRMRDRTTADWAAPQSAVVDRSADDVTSQVNITSNKAHVIFFRDKLLVLKIYYGGNF